MMRNAAQRLSHTLSRVVKPGSCRSLAAYGRCYHKGPRNLPIHRRSFFDDFFHDRPGFGWPGRLMTDNFRNMQRLMDEMMHHGPWRGPRMWDSFEYARPFARAAGAKDVEIKFDQHVFEVKVDVSGYAPEELDVQVSGDKLNISGKYQEKPDQHGFVSQEFTRQFLIPEEVEAETIESMLTNDGYLVVKGQVRGGEKVEPRTIKIDREAPKDEGAKPKPEIETSKSIQYGLQKD